MQRRERDTYVDKLDEFRAVIDVAAGQVRLERLWLT